MMEINELQSLQDKVCNKKALKTLEDYKDLCKEFLQFIENQKCTEQGNYMFFQYPGPDGKIITRPLNKELFIRSANDFKTKFEWFTSFIPKLSEYKDKSERERFCQCIEPLEMNKIVYTLQQSIGCIGDSLKNSNQSRKRIGQLFERLIKLIIQQLGLECKSRTINIEIPGYSNLKMSYELDLVLSRKKVTTTKNQSIDESNIVGSVKTTSKDRIDKVFLDKYLLTKLLNREVPVIAIFLHDVQRAKVGNNEFGIKSTLKSNHFLAYTKLLKRLDGVYYIDPPSEINEELRKQISDFQTFLVRDLWELPAIQSPSIQAS